MEYQGKSYELPVESDDYLNVKRFFDELWSNYPSNNIKHLGPDGEDIFNDHCAIHVSHSLLKSNVSMNTFRGVKCWGCRSNVRHAIRAQEVADWLLDQSIRGISHVQILTGANFESNVTNKQGIIFFKDYWRRNGQANRTSDHIDLWNKNELKSIGTIATWIRTTFPEFSECNLNMSDLRQSTQVLFWEIK